MAAPDFAVLASGVEERTEFIQPDSRFVAEAVDLPGIQRRGGAAKIVVIRRDCRREAGTPVEFEEMLTLVQGEERPGG